VSGADNLFISDSGNHRIYQVTTMTEPHLRFEPETISVGGIFNATFLGLGLTAETYFDLRFHSPGDDQDQVILNWQRGILAGHAALGAIPGHWTVIGVRPHRTIDDHSADFTPVSATLTVVE
jgi:hypothetical protein